MQWNLARHIEENIKRLKEALDESAKQPDLEGNTVRRAVMHISGSQSSKVGRGIVFVHVRYHDTDGGFFQIQIRDTWTTVDTVEQVEEWVRNEFGIVAELWRPEFI